MSGTLNLLTQDGGTTDIPSITTASITVTAGRPVFVIVTAVGDLATSGDPHSLSGAGQTWVQIYSAPVAGDDSAYTRCSIWTSDAASGGSGALTITTPDLSAWAYAVVEFEPSAGATATLGTEVEATIAEAATSNSIAITAADYWVALSGVSKASGYGSLTATPRTDWTEVAEAVGLDSGWLGGIHVQLSPLDGDTDASVTWSQSVNIVLVAVPVTLTGGGPAANEAVLTATEGGDTAAVSVSTLTDLDLAATEGSDTAAISVTTKTGLALAVTEGGDAAAISVTTKTGLALAATEGGDTAAVSVSTLTDLDLAATEGSDTASFSAITQTDLDLAATEGSDTASLTIGDFAILVDVVATEGGDTAALDVTVKTGLTLTATEGSDTAAISVTTKTDLALTTTEGSDAATISVTTKTDLVLAATEGSDAATISVTTKTDLVLAATEGSDTAAIIVSAVDGLTLAATESSDTAAIIVGILTDLDLTATEGSDTAAINITRAYAPPSFDFAADRDGVTSSRSTLRPTKTAALTGSARAVYD